MNGMGVGHIGIPWLAGGAALIFGCLLFLGRRRRRGGMFAACMILLIGLGGFALLMPRAVHSRLANARHGSSRQGSISVSRSHPHDPQPPDPPEEPCDSEEVDESLEAESTSEDVESTSAAVIYGPNGVRVETGRGSSVKVEVDQPTRAPRDRSKSGGGQVVSSILLAGLVLAGYFFLNANTRGHYTWRLRVGSTLVFLASLAAILAVGGLL